MTFHSILNAVFQAPLGLLAGVSLLALLLLYLIRPEPPEEAFPSVMFLLNDEVQKQQEGWWRKLFHDLLLLLQLVTLLLFTVAAAQPLVTLPQAAAVGDAVFVLDVSASMQAGNRFTEAVTAVEEHVGEENTLILAGAAPETVVEDRDSAVLREQVTGLQPRDVAGSLAEAVRAAEHVATAETTVHVMSDFATRSNLEQARNIVESTGATVEFVQVGSTVENTGITDVRFPRNRMEVTVANKNRAKQNYTVQGGGESWPVQAAPGESTTISVDQPVGTVTLTLSPSDDFSVDDQVHVVGRPPENISVAVLSNNASRFLTTALDVNSQVDSTVVRPPTTTDLSRFDAVIVEQVETSNVLPRTVRQLRQLDNTALILMASPQLLQLDVNRVNPVNMRGTIHSKAVQRLPHPVTHRINFGVNQFYNASLKPGSSTLAVAGETPVIAAQENTVYYGIIDDLSRFKYDLYYPIFWKRLLQDVTGHGALTQINKQTGELLEFDAVTRVETPGGVKEGRVIRMDDQGFYHVGRRTVSANLLSNAESTTPMKSLEQQSNQQEAVGATAAPVEVTQYIAAAILLLLLIELAYLKYRGDL